MKLELVSALDEAEEFIKESAYYQQRAAQCSQKALSLQKQALLRNLDYIITLIILKIILFIVSLRLLFEDTTFETMQ